jgi:hypothetical protein
MSPSTPIPSPETVSELELRIQELEDEISRLTHALDSANSPLSDRCDQLAKAEPTWGEFLATALELKHEGWLVPSTAATSLGGKSSKERTALNILKGYKRQLEHGDKFAILIAISFCAETGLPLPEWLAKAYQSAFNSFQTSWKVKIDPSTKLPVALTAMPQRSIVEAFGLPDNQTMVKPGLIPKKVVNFARLRMLARHLRQKDTTLKLSPSERLAFDQLGFPEKRFKSIEAHLRELDNDQGDLLAYPAGQVITRRRARRKAKASS